MRIRIFILSFMLLFWNISCVPIGTVLGTIGAVGMAARETQKLRLEARSLDLREVYLEILARELEVSERVDVLEEFMKIFPKPVEALDKSNEREI